MSVVVSDTSDSALPITPATIVGRSASQIAVISAVSFRATPSSAVIGSLDLARRITTAGPRRRAGADAWGGGGAPSRGVVVAAAPEFGARPVEEELIVGDGHRIEKARAGGSGGVQLGDAGVILAQAQLARRQQHPVGLDAANLAALKLAPAGERGAYGGEGVFPARLHVGRAAHHLERPADPAGVDEAQRQAVSVRGWLRLEHLGAEHAC